MFYKTPEIPSSSFSQDKIILPIKLFDLGLFFQHSFSFAPEVTEETSSECIAKMEAGVPFNICIAIMMPFLRALFAEMQ